MLLPRCTHRRLWCTPPREFHTTRPYLRDAPDIFQMDPHTAEAVIGSSPWLSKSRPMDNGRTSMKLRAGKQNVQKEELFSTKLSLHLRPRDRSARASEGDGGIGSRVSRNQAVLNESLSLQKTSARRKTRPDASRNAGKLPYPFCIALFHLLPQRSQFPINVEGLRPLRLARQFPHFSQMAEFSHVSTVIHSSKVRCSPSLRPVFLKTV